jgi:hypothetical protein
MRLQCPADNDGDSLDRALFVADFAGRMAIGFGVIPNRFFVRANLMAP